MKREKAELESLVKSRTKGGSRVVPSGVKRRDPEILVRHGKVASPARGSLVRGFGRIKDERYGTFTQNDGIDVEAPLGTGVRAIMKGKVVYADWFRGYGKLVIIDHGEQYFSVSGDLESINVRVGDEVGAGARIGAVGRVKGKGTLYFELRHGADTLDPSPWFGI